MMMLKAQNSYHKCTLSGRMYLATERGEKGKGTNRTRVSRTIAVAIVVLVRDLCRTCTVVPGRTQGNQSVVICTDNSRPVNFVGVARAFACDANPTLPKNPVALDGSQAFKSLCRKGTYQG